MLNWSAHVESWTKNIPFPVLVVRYEDMVLDTIETFTKALSFLGIDASTQRIEQAINKTSFQNLKDAEAEKGFRESTKKNNPFFRKGKAGSWIEELTTTQVEVIKKKHENIMQQYHYI
ncbi:Sulfotransferase domain protein [compost metagenome]